RFPGRITSMPPGLRPESSFSCSIICAAAAPPPNRKPRHSPPRLNWRPRGVAAMIRPVPLALIRGTHHAQDCTGDRPWCRTGSPCVREEAEIEAVNAKWIECFNKGDFAGLASLYTDDATAFPPGSGMVKGRAAIEALWKNMAEQVTDPK